MFAFKAILLLQLQRSFASLSPSPSAALLSCLELTTDVPSNGITDLSTCRSTTLALSVTGDPDAEPEPCIAATHSCGSAIFNGITIGGCFPSSLVADVTDLAESACSSDPVCDSLNPEGASDVVICETHDCNPCVPYEGEAVTTSEKLLTCNELTSLSDGDGGIYDFDQCVVTNIALNFGDGEDDLCVAANHSCASIFFNGGVAVGGCFPNSILPDLTSAAVEACQEDAICLTKNPGGTPAGELVCNEDACNPCAPFVASSSPTSSSTTSSTLPSPSPSPSNDPNDNTDNDNTSPPGEGGSATSSPSLLIATILFSLITLFSV